MKENGINKLMDLLNEYDDGMVSRYEEYFSTEGLFVTNAGQCFREEFILSKKFGFIKWLVDNDKIDKQKVKEKSEFLHIYTIPNPEKYYKSLIMELSIQDNPIEFLVSILK